MNCTGLSRRDCLLGMGAGVLAATVARPAAAADLAPDRALLFLDDLHVETLDRLQRTMHPPVKRGAVIRSAVPEKGIQTRSAPAWDPAERVFKLWVMGIEEVVWRSPDGLHWTPAPLPNMRVDHVVCDTTDPDPERRFKGALTNQGFAVSPDGVRWTKLDVPPVPSSDESNLSFDPGERLFIHSVKRGTRNGRSVAIAVSRDFRTWTDHGLVFQTDEVDQMRGAENIRARLADASLQQPSHVTPSAWKVDVYNMGVFHYEGQYVGLPALYHATGNVPNYPNTDGFHLVQLAHSRDLKKWARLGDRKPFIAPSRLDSGAYDLTQILPPSAPVVHGDELWFYYTGLKRRATFRYVGAYPNGEAISLPGISRDVGGVCLAVLRRDGFVSVDAGEAGGELLTRPMDIAGRELLLNLATGEGGEAVVELVDEAGKSLAVSTPVTGDGVRLPVAWKGGANMTRAAGRKVRLKVRLRNASLYAVRTRA